MGDHRGSAAETDADPGRRTRLAWSLHRGSGNAGDGEMKNLQWFGAGWCVALFLATTFLFLKVLPEPTPFRLFVIGACAVFSIFKAISYDNED